jgi:uridine kinase
MKYWEIEKVTESNSNKEDTIVVELVNKDYRDESVSIKWDGCVHLHKYWNGYTVDDPHSEEKANNSDYIHICDIDEMIEKLQELKEVAKVKFSKQNYEEYWAR